MIIKIMRRNSRTACRGEVENCIMVSVRNPEAIRPLESLWFRGRNIIKNDVKKYKIED